MRTLRSIDWRPGWLLLPATGLVIGLVAHALSGPKTATTASVPAAALASETAVRPGPALPGSLPKVAVPRLRQPASALRTPARPAAPTLVTTTAPVTPQAPAVVPQAPVRPPVAAPPAAAPQPQRGPSFDSSG
jgi:hypothetical protein